ncbi:MAG: cell envelope integrity protein TolA, partial [Gammaproteobacteria bacterium]|nr:cell envelope integrity protein TolA [Gammaproteobacteria bacterium]
KRLAEEKKRKAVEAKRLAKEKERKAAEAKRLAEEKKRKAAEARRLAEEKKRKAAARRQAELEAAMQAERDASETRRYQGLIRQKINRSWVRPSGVGDGLKCLLRVRVAPGGTVIAATVVESSGNGAFDRSATHAVMKADPLPVPAGSLFEAFRDINFLFQPKN